MTLAAAARIPVEPGVLRWARQAAQVEVPQAAVRLGVSEDRLRSWEAGAVLPTLNQLRKMADVYDRPLAAFFMPAPPPVDETLDLPDFRRVEVRADRGRALSKGIFRARRQQEALRDVAEELEVPESDGVPLLNLDMREGPEAGGAVLREALGLDAISAGTFFQPEVLLRTLIRKSESLNISVIQVQRVPVGEMRGFSLGEGSYPVLALNGADWPRGKLFTLLHECAHIGLRSSGLCDLSHGADADVERFCDNVAAAALMPAKPFIKLATPRPSALTVDFCKAVGNEFGASGEAALIRMINLSLAAWEDYRALKPQFDAAYNQYRLDEKERNADKDSPIFYQLKARDLGRRFIRQMLAAHQESALSSRDLVQLLGVSYDKVPKLASLVGEEAS